MIWLDHIFGISFQNGHLTQSFQKFPISLQWTTNVRKFTGSTSDRHAYTLFDSYLYSSREQSSSITNKFFNIEIHDVSFPLSILIPKIFYDEGDSVQAETGTTVPLNQNKRIVPHFPGALIARPEKRQRNLRVLTGRPDHVFRFWMVVVQSRDLRGQIKGE